MCKATSNSNISWSKKWNLHLTAFFNNVQSPFNRKMEQSANRKRKGLIKTHPSPSWRSPRYGNTAHAELGGAGAPHGPTALTALTNSELEEKGQGQCFHWGLGWWLPAYINLLCCLLRKTKQQKPNPPGKAKKWALSSVQQWQGLSFSTQRHWNLGTAPSPKEWAISSRRSWLFQRCDFSGISSPATARAPFKPGHPRVFNSQHWQKNLPSHSDPAWQVDLLLLLLLLLFSFLSFILQISY